MSKLSIDPTTERTPLPGDTIVQELQYHATDLQALACHLARVTADPIVRERLSEEVRHLDEVTLAIASRASWIVEHVEDLGASTVG